MGMAMRQHRRRCQHRAGGEGQRVPVGRGLRDRLHGDEGARAAAVLHHDVAAAHRGREPVREDAAEQVHRPARGEGDDEPDVARDRLRPGRGRRREERRGGGRQGEEKGAEHGGPPSR
jgi:hypothetical protein